ASTRCPRPSAPPSTPCSRGSSPPVRRSLEKPSTDTVVEGFSRTRSVVLLRRGRLLLRRRGALGRVLVRGSLVGLCLRGRLCLGRRRGGRGLRLRGLGRWRGS